VTGRLIFAANWKMHLGPDGARRFFDAFLPAYAPRADREVWFFPPAVSLPAAAAAIHGRADIRAGAQDVHWERSGAFTGEVSAELAREAGATLALVGHSERRQVFGETDDMAARKLRSILAAGLTPLLCVGETLAERQNSQTIAVVQRQLGVALAGLEPSALGRVVLAYEPVWAIGTGHNATPAEAGQVHREIRTLMAAHGGPGRARVLYGGSVRRANVRELLAEPELDGVLVGGASLDAAEWAAIVQSSVTPR
jgi:triosephosphate isomerase